MTVELQEGVYGFANYVRNALAAGNAVWTARLYQQVAIITELSIESNLIEATYSGYARQTFIPVATTFDFLNDRAVLQGGSVMTWTVTGTGPGNNISGVGIHLDNDVYTGPYNCLVYVPISPALRMASIGDTFSFTPNVWFKHGD